MSYYISDRESVQLGTQKIVEVYYSYLSKKENEDIEVYSEWSSQSFIIENYNMGSSYRKEVDNLSDTIKERFYNGKKDISLSEEREYSFIKDDDWTYWKNIDNRILDDKIENHFKAIITRRINIYECFWDDLKINELIEL